MSTFGGFHGRQVTKISLDITAMIPEPATWLLLTISSVYLLGTRYRRNEECGGVKAA